MLKEKVYLGLGSNLGERESFLESALNKLAESEDIELVRISPVYETEPVGLTEQDNFLNIAVEIRTGLSPQELMLHLEEIEKLVGKKAEIKNGPREIDIDILLYDKEVVEGENLVIPHPGLCKREFALRPLLDINPFLADPTTNTPYSLYLKRIKGEKKVSLKRDIYLGIEN